MSDSLLARPFINRLGIRPGEPTILSIQQAVCDKYRITLAEMLSTRRDRILVLPRHEAMVEAHRLTSASLPAIGRAFKRGHHTVLHAVQKASK